MSRCPHCSQDHAATNHFCPVTGAPIPLGSRLLSSKLLNKYTVIRVLGEGPIGVVLEVEDIETRRHFAAKVIHPRYTRDPAAAKNFMEDVVRLQSILSPNVARVVQVGRDAGAAIVVIRELMNGECLAVRLQRVGRFPIQEAVAVAREMLLALQALHQSAVINLDLSPSDIFLVPGPNGLSVKMLDIGERHIKAALPSDAARPESYNYFAPEQLDRSRQPNLRSDFYAVGVMLYQMISGAVPEGEPSPLTVVRPEVPPDLARIASKASASMPNNRYQSAAEFLHDLDSIVWTPAPAQAATAPPLSASNQASVPPPNSGPNEALSPAASVIVEMPEIQPPSSKKKAGIIAAALLALACGAGALIYFGSADDGGADKVVETVEITIEVVPSDATVQADGKRIEGNPPVLRVPVDTDLHTIAAKANGHEALERDVRYDRSKVVKIELMEIIQPDEPAPSEQDVASGGIPASAPVVSPIQPKAPTASSEGRPRAASTPGASASRKQERRATGAGSAGGGATGKSKRNKKADSEKAAASTDKKSTKKSRPVKNEEGFRVTNPFE